jgi:uncharacterized membrane protein YgdD (TMEM256/DUF423 family)
MEYVFFIIGAISGGLFALAGAFGVHSLKDVLEPAQLVSYENVVWHQMVLC